MDVSCSDAKCDRNVNERLVRIIQSFMDMNADPCQDFFKFSCGSWTNVTDIASSFQRQEQTYNDIIVKIFENWQTQVKAGKGEELKLNAAYEKALNYYSSCRSADSIDLKKFLSVIEPAPLQKWPIFENRSSLPWNFENFVWWKVLAKLQSYDMTQVLFTVKIDSDTTSNKKYGVIVTTPGPDKTVNYLSLRVFEAMGRYTKVQMKLLKEKLLSFEKDLNSAIKGEEEQEEPVSDFAQMKFITLSELQSELDGIDLQEYFKILLQGENIQLPHDNIFYIAEADKPAIKRLITFLNESSKESIALYLMAYFLEHLEKPLPWASSEQDCAKFLRSLMPVAVAHTYEDNYYGAIREESDAVIHTLFDRLTSKVRDLVEANDIDLTEQEIEYLKRKSKNMGVNIGNLPGDKSKGYLVEYYANVNITDATNFYHNHLELLHHKQILLYRMLNTYHENPKNVYETFDPVIGWGASASPYNLRTRNLVIFPFAYLQMPLYHHKLHDVFQYAELGFTTGHEIMHGFDASGVWFDAYGNYNALGVGISNNKGFKEKLECLSKVKTASVDERIADVAGIRLTMEAFFNERTSKVKKFRTHSTTLTNHQIFFVKLSQYFCEVLEEGEQDLSELSHDLSNVRVVYTMSNTHEFAHEFKCAANTAVRPEKVCQLW